MNGSFDEVSPVRGVDECAGHSHAQSKPKRKASSLRVRKSSQVRHDGIYRGAPWPFFYIIEGGRTYINPASRRKTARVEEEARW